MCEEHVLGGKSLVAPLHISKATKTIAIHDFYNNVFVTP